MSACSSSLRSGARHRSAPAAPVIPLVPCPDCGRQVKMGVSGTEEHTGWIYYKCRFHGSTCDFWNWEREYVYYLSEKNVLEGDAEIYAVCWAEERREELESALEKKKKKLAIQWGTGHGDGSSSNGARGDAIMKKTMSELVVQGRQMFVLMKVALGMMFFLAVLCVALILK